MNPASQLSLNDILLPQAIGIWPLAPGWWLLLVLAIITPIIIYALLRWRQRVKQQRQPLRQALAAIEALADQTMSPALCAALNEVLKTYCLKRQPAAVALHGQAWGDFLRSRASAFNKQQEQWLSHGAYLAHIPQTDNDAVRSLCNAAQQWLKKTDQRNGANHA